MTMASLPVRWTWTLTLVPMLLTTMQSRKRVRGKITTVHHLYMSNITYLDSRAPSNTESLSGLEVEMRKLEGVVKEIVEELNYLKRREARMRDTNESTNERVWWFSLLTAATLVSLGIWQILYLRSYFKRKHLID